MAGDNLPPANPPRREITKARRQLDNLCQDIKMVCDAGASHTRPEDIISAEAQAEFVGMTEVLDQTYSRYLEIYDNTIDVAEDLKVTFPTPEDIDKLAEVKLLYFQAKGHKVRLTRASTTLNSSVSHDSTNIHSSSRRTLLPKIQIKTFSGEFSEWTTFHQLFTALVIDDRSLSDAERFHYLTSFLDGVALDAIKHIKVIDINFQQAWEALKRVFDDKRRIANAYLENLLNYKPASGRPTADSLQHYLSHVSESITSLKNLEINQFAEFILCELALRALDTKTREAYELQWVQVGTTFPTFDSLKQFVENRCHVLRLTAVNNTCKSEPSNAPKPFKNPNKFAKGQALLAHTESRGIKRTAPRENPTKQHSNPKFECFVCKQPHRIVTCPEYLKMDPVGRLNALKTYPGCYNCMHPAHQSSKCDSGFTCKYCSKRHHSTLHIFPPSDPKPVSSSQTSLPFEVPNQQQRQFCGASTSSGTSGVLLGTVICRIRDSEGNYRSYRGILDPGSQYSFLKSQTCRDLKLSVEPHDGAISGVNQSNLQNLQGKVTLSIQTPPGYHTLETQAVVVPSITPALPQVKLNAAVWEFYKTYQLSDPTFTDPGPIHFLIGADLYCEVVTGVPIIIQENGPRLMATIFGFTVIGRYSVENLNNRNQVALLAHADPMFHIEKFWETEEPTVVTPKASPDDEKCEKHFQETHYRTSEGRYVVALPFKEPEPKVEPNIAGALNRLYSLETKLSKNDILRAEYNRFMFEYESLGHLRVATSAPKFVIPHHPVFRVDGEKRKLRIVFDGSFRSSTGALNDKLHKGPALQSDISNILLNMRRFQYVLTCDIVKMFRQVEIRPEDRCYQQIAWRYNPHDPVVFYELNTVTYGTRPAPWLSMRVIRALVDDEGANYPNAARSLSNFIYVDDIIDGRDSTEELIQLKAELESLLAKGGFSLSKWASNYFPILNETELSEDVSLCKDENLTTKILGMHWSPRTDCFSYVVTPITSGNSKRIILSTIARLFDPCGLICPIIFYAKCIMQETWKHKLNWDEDVPNYIIQVWNKFTTELPAVSKLSINRALPKTDTSYQLLCFADASERGYCAVAYVRSTHASKVSMTLVKAKSRLSPLKSETVPRLELCGAVLLAELLDSLTSFCENLGLTEIYCFSDSAIVLAWLRTPPHLLQIYVSRRVQRVLESTKFEWWRHAKGCENPADVGSRGTTPAALETHPLWWTGPEWCYQPIEKWPQSGDILLSDVPELKPIKLSLFTVDEPLEFHNFVSKYSSWLRLVRVVARIRRFVANCRVPKILKSSRINGPLSANEIRDANYHIIRILQYSNYPEVFTNSSFNNLPLELRRLNVFIDSHGVIRVGGRIEKAPISENQKHPILLPARCHFTTILARHYHKENNHVGPSTLLAILRQQYWIPNGRNLMKRVHHRCVVCTRYSRKRVTPFMGNLPSSRFAAVRPFLICGVDFAGFFLCKESTRKNARTFKCYLSIFVCMSTRAYHLELVTSLTVEGFLDAFTRFTARRGVPSKVLSDNATNFVGTVNYLETVYEWLRKNETQAGIIDGTSHLGVDWQFIPPASPHFGGSWEIGVKAVKTLLHKTCNNMSYTQEELNTMIIKIEGILNSRPLQPLPTSTDDPEALTPAHFLIGQPLNSVPEIDFTDVPANRLTRWQIIQERIQHFWSRWKVEYLSNLQLREKWNKKTPNVKIGDVVLLSDPNIPPMRWPMARVLKVHPGEDQTVRIVTLKTARGIYDRPVVKLVPLPINSVP